jgi:hypothetical protein
MAEDLEAVNEAVAGDTPVAVAKSPLTLPFMLTLAALTIYFAFQTVQLLADRSNLIAVKGSQEGAIQEAQKVQAQFKNLVGKTGELADQGHAGAKMVMEELFQRGIGAAPQAAPPQTKLPETKAPTKGEAKPAK